MSAPEPDLVPFNPHASPPMGSRGDLFDGKIGTQGGDRLAVSRASSASRMRAKSKPRENVKPPVFALAHIGPVLVLVGVLSQAAIDVKVRLYLVFFGVLASAACVALLKTKLKGWGGFKRSVAAAVLGFLYLAMPARVSLDRIVAKGTAHVGAMLPSGARKSVPGPPKTALELKKEDWAREVFEHRENMEKIAAAASCIVQECGADTVIVPGMYGGELPARGWRFYEGLPMLNLEDDCGRAAARKFYELYEVADKDLVSGLPRPFCDRFSPEGHWPFGIFERSGSIVVWSPGPDGDMDYSPVKDFRTDKPDYMSALSAKSYDPTNGAISSGDVVVVHKMVKEDCPQNAEFY